MSHRSIAVRSGIAAAAVLIAIAAEARFWRWHGIHDLTSWLGTHVVSVLAVVVIGLVLVYAPVRDRLSARVRLKAPTGGGARWPWLLSDPGLFTVVGVLAGIGVFALIVMLTLADGVAAGADRAKLQVDAIKYGLGSIAAGGAAAALLLAVRRQRHTEQVHAHTVDDAAERRVTELYTKAVEQLGSADAAVRLGGLYALERVAGNNAGQRQTVVNVLCAYLRMPYTPPGGPDVVSALLQSAVLPQAPAAETTPIRRDPVQERQVRLAAQRILATHGRPGEEGFWGDVQLDLSGAVLIELTLDGACLDQASFTDAVFVGDTSFRATKFRDGVSFRQATFQATAAFDGAVFSGGGVFDEVSFGGSTSFAESAFDGAASFQAVNFLDRARFREARLTDAAFGGARFSGPVQFGAATFIGRAVFSGAEFVREARFGEAQFAKCKFVNARFKGEAWFGGAVFSGPADFVGASFGDSALFLDSRFEADAKFGETSFESEASFARVTFEQLATFGGAHFSASTFTSATFMDRAWFVAATFADIGVFDEATFHGDCRFTTNLPGNAVRLSQTRVANRLDRKDEWPEGWRPEPSAAAVEEEFQTFRKQAVSLPKNMEIVDI